MKHLILALFLAASSATHAQQLFSATSKTFDVPFDLSVTEVKRENRSSTIQVTNFYRRTAPATRWMMCMINTLAILRGYDFWTVVYPSPPTAETMGAAGEMLVGFSRIQTEKVSDNDPRFASQYAMNSVVSVAQGASLCLGYRSGQ
jgi:hypothetical protein